MLRTALSRFSAQARSNLESTRGWFTHGQHNKGGNMTHKPPTRHPYVGCAHLSRICTSASMALVLKMWYVRSTLESVTVRTDS